MSSTARLAEGQAIHPVPTALEAFEPFYALDYKENSDWHDFTVPGNWEMAGYSPATYWNPDNASGEFQARVHSARGLERSSR